MRLFLWLAGLWPGFIQAGLAGRCEGLILAVAFAAALNIALVTSIGWLGADSPAASAAIAWLMVIGLWIGGAVWLRRDDPRLNGSTSGTCEPQLETWFCEAQHEYLKGHLIEAESLLRRLLSRRPNDVEATLLLATIQRRTACWAEAKRTLDNLNGNDATVAWMFEVESERRQITGMQAETSHSETSNSIERENKGSNRSAKAA
jgi:hypothetical protein